MPAQVPIKPLPWIKFNTITRRARFRWQRVYEILRYVATGRYGTLARRRTYGNACRNHHESGIAPVINRRRHQERTMSETR